MYCTMSVWLVFMLLFLPFLVYIPHSQGTTNSITLILKVMHFTCKSQAGAGQDNRCQLFIPLGRTYHLILQPKCFSFSNINVNSNQQMRLVRDLVQMNSMHTKSGLLNLIDNRPEQFISQKQHIRIYRKMKYVIFALILEQLQQYFASLYSVESHNDFNDTSVKESKNPTNILKMLIMCNLT